MATPESHISTVLEREMLSLHKGSRVRAIGSLHTRSREDREIAQKRFKAVVRSEESYLDMRQERQDANETLEEAAAQLPTNPTRVRLTLVLSS